MKTNTGCRMKLYLLILTLFLAAPAQASGGTVLGMIFTVVFVVVMLVLYWMVVAEVGDKDKR